MPNICENKLEITTTNKNLVRWIQNFCEKGEIEYNEYVSQKPPTGLFQYIAPMPTELEGTTKGSHPPKWQTNSSEALIDAYGADNWYDWQCKNWGTKWDVYCDDIKSWYVDHRGSEYFVYLVFDTAWGPPTEAIKRLKMSYAAQISFLRILYVAEGDFCGIYNGLTGEHIEDTEFVDDPEMPRLTAKYQENEDPVWDYGWIQEEVEDRVNEVAEYHNERLKEVDNEQRGPDVQVRTRFTETEDGSNIWDEGNYNWESK